VIPGHLAQVGDKVVFGHRLMELNDEGQSSGTEPKIRELTGGALEVSAVTGDTIQFKPQEVFAPLTEAMKALALETTFDLHPFACKLKDKSGGRARLQILGLMPNQKDIPFDYQVSFLLRQPGGKKWVRTWEIDPPEGLKYSGPGTVIFSPWLIIPWIFVDFDPDEQALNQLPATGDRLA
jgi:hypothetical protein